MEYPIELVNISKSFKVYKKPSDRLKELLSPGESYCELYHVLKRINLKITKGTTVGIIGQNGSGKSTLLQIICGILKPSNGEVKVNGRISALLELGAGFNPEFTGIENVYMNGAIQGFTKEEMDARFPLIENFAEIGEFIHQPVKTYSSGMYVRLAFAAAINVDPDILIVDEALAVGDLYFQLKCINKIKEFKKNNKTILYVTHDTYSVKNICDYAVWIHEGEIRLQGDPIYVVNQYEDYMKKKNGTTENLSSDVSEPNVVAEERRVLEIRNAVFCKYRTDFPKQQFEVHDGLTIKITYELYEKIDQIVAGVAIFDAKGTSVCALNTKLDEIMVRPKELGENTILLHYNKINLLPGTYFIDVGFFEESAVARLDYKSKISNFNVISNRYIAEGVVLLEHEWEVV